MPQHERFVVLVPAMVTFLVIVLVDNTYNVRSAIAPFVHHVATHLRYFFGTVVGSAKG